MLYLVLLMSVLPTGWGGAWPQATPSTCDFPIDPSLTLTAEAEALRLGDFDVELAAFLNAGGDPANIVVEGRVAALQVDVMGDAGLDWVIDLVRVDGTAADAPISGGLYALTCVEGAYTGGTVNSPYHGVLGPRQDVSAVGLQALADVTGDGRPELIYSIYTPMFNGGPLTREYYALEWAPGRPAEGNTTGWQFLLPTDEFGGLGLMTIDGSLDASDGTLRITEQPFYDPDNPQVWSRLRRPMTYHWVHTEAGERMSVTCAQAATPAIYRVQALEDASHAMTCGDLTAAMSLYMAAYDDPDLLPWTEVDNRCPGCDPARDADEIAQIEAALGAEGYVLPDTEREDDLRAYAYYRLMLVFNLMGYPDAAEGTWQALEAAYPDHRYTQLAMAYREGGCPRALGYALEQGLTTPFVDYNFDPYWHTWLDPHDEPLCVGPDMP